MSTTIREVREMVEIQKILEETCGRASADMQLAFREIHALAEDVNRESRAWIYSNAPEGAEPITVKRLMDEIETWVHAAPVLRGTDGQHQFFLRSLFTTLALATTRYLILTGAGRLGEMHREPQAEHRVICDAFRAARAGFAPQHEIGAALAEARQRGIAGGSWAAFILDGHGA